MNTAENQWFHKRLLASNAQEARAWLNGNPEQIRTLGELGSRAESIALVEKAYGAGATCVTAVEIDRYPDPGGGENTGRLIITLPDLEEKRASVLRWAGEIVESHGFDREEDTGQRYVYVGLD